MFPSKNNFDYMNEINRLFSRVSENEMQMPNRTNTFNQSPFSNSTMGNQSSSSADSTSPEVFPYFSPATRSSMDHRSFPVKRSSDTPVAIKRQRAIVGRKILGNTDYSTPIFDSPMQLSPVRSVDSEMERAWETNNRTPPNNRMLLEQHNYTPNCYELFPTESRGYEFKTPVKKQTFTPTACSVPMSPNSPMSNSSVSSNLTNNFTTPPPLYRRNISSNYGAGSSYIKRENTGEKICSFCRKNGETPMVYMTHVVKEMVGNKNVVTCPILRSHVCSTCGESGDNAHTITYCPILRSSNHGRPLQSTTITLKNTRVKSNGRKRRLSFETRSSQRYGGVAQTDGTPALRRRSTDGRHASATAA